MELTEEWAVGSAVALAQFTVPVWMVELGSLDAWQPKFTGDTGFTIGEGFVAAVINGTSSTIIEYTLGLAIDSVTPSPSLTLAKLEQLFVCQEHSVLPPHDSTC